MVHPRGSLARRAWILSALGAALVARPVAPTSPATAQFDDVRRHIGQVLVSDGLPSIAVAVAKEGEIIWEEGFGWADRENRTPATEHTMYSIASVTKPITATGVMVLVERGLVDLDRPINDYLGDAKIQGRAADASGATVRRLANHTSGLPSHDQRFYVDEPFRAPPMDETIMRYGFLATAPGERVRYSNLGFGILDHIISRVSGARYADFMHDEVFIPLSMTRSSVGIGAGLDSYQAQRYGGGGELLPFYDSDTLGAAGIYSSAHDLIRFAMFHLKDRLPDQKAILSDELIDRMAAPTGTGPADREYGIGWALSSAPGAPASFGHDGGMIGVTTSLVLFPEEDIAIVVLCNANTSQVGTLVDMIRGVVLPAPGDGEDSRVGQPLGPQRPEPFSPGPELVGTWRGQVDFHTGAQPIVLEIRPDGDVHALVGDGRPRWAARRMWTLVNQVSFRDGLLTGYLPPGPRADRAFRWQYVRMIDLTLRGPVLNGTLTIFESSRHTNRGDSGLNYWVELTKEN